MILKYMHMLYLLSDTGIGLSDYDRNFAKLTNFIYKELLGVKRELGAIKSLLICNFLSVLCGV